MFTQRHTAALQGLRNGRTGARCALPLPVCWAGVGDFVRALPPWQILTQHYYGNSYWHSWVQGGSVAQSKTRPVGHPPCYCNYGHTFVYNTWLRQSRVIIYVDFSFSSGPQGGLRTMQLCITCQHAINYSPKSALSAVHIFDSYYFGDLHD